MDYDKAIDTLNDTSSLLERLLKKVTTPTLRDEVSRVNDRLAELHDEMQEEKAHREES